MKIKLTADQLEDVVRSEMEKIMGDIRSCGYPRELSTYNAAADIILAYYSSPSDYKKAMDRVEGL